MNKHLRDKYCIVGVGETEYSHGSNRSTRAMAVESLRNAMDDAGLTSEGVDGIMSYHLGDSTLSTTVRQYLRYPHFVVFLAPLAGLVASALIGAMYLSSVHLSAAWGPPSPHFNATLVCVCVSCL